MSFLSNFTNCQRLAISNEGLSQLTKNASKATFPGQHVIWTDQLRYQLPIRVGKNGPLATDPTTIIDEWKKTLILHGSKPALSVKRNNKWQTINYQQYYQQCIKFAQSLLQLGCGQFATVNIIGFNSPEWVVAFYGSVFAKCIPVGIYCSNSQASCQYIAHHSQSRVIVAENLQYAKKYLGMLEKGQIERIIVYGEDVGSNNFGGRLVTWKAFIDSGKKVSLQRVQDRMNHVNPGNCCTLVYTSGTTGMPKGVMISHDNMTWTQKSLLVRIPEGNQPLRIVSYLPLSHSAGQFCDIIAPIICGYHVFFADPSALQGTLLQTIQQVKPQSFFTVPRVWEKIHDKMVEVSKNSGPVLSKISAWAKSIGEQGTLQEARHQPTSWQFKLAKRFFFNRIKATLGLENCILFGFGAAPLDPVVRKYFFSINFFLQNGYGMTQTTAGQNCTSASKLDLSDLKGYLQVGIGLPGTQMKIQKQKQTDEQGQICMRGRNTFMGYFKNAEETSKTIDSSGFIHSGDNGRITKEGILFITGRIKQLIITAGGENIPPVLIENQIKNALPCVSNAMVIGDNRRYLTCLITLKEDPPYSGTLDKATRDYLQNNGVAVKTVKEAISHPSLRTAILEGLKISNSKAISRAQHVQDFIVLPQDFSLQQGLLTPTLKLRRKQVLKKYAAQIETLYQKAKL